MRAMSRRRTKPERLRTRRLVCLAVFLGASLVGANFARITAREHALAREIAGVQADIVLLELQNAALKLEVERRGTSDYVVQKARELGYVRPGEGLAAVKDSRRSTTTAPSVATRGELVARIARWIALFLY